MYTLLLNYIRDVFLDWFQIELWKKDPVLGNILCNLLILIGHYNEEYRALWDEMINYAKYDLKKCTNASNS